VKEGMRAYDIEYTLNAQGKVARYSYTLAPQGSRKEIPEVTTITYANGKVARAEARREDSSGISITVTDYNAAGLAVRELQTIYDQQMKVISLSGYVYEYVMDASGNWVEQREYEEEGKTRTLNASDTRVIAYLNK